MNRLKKALSVLSAAAVAAAMTAPLSAAAEGDDGLCKVTFHFEEYHNGTPFVLECPPNVTLPYAIGYYAYDGDAGPLFLPEPENGEAICGWSIGEDKGTSFDLAEDMITEDLELYPEIAEVTSPGTLMLEAEDDYMPQVGRAVPEPGFTAHISVPEGADYAVADAYYDTEDTEFREGEVYPLSVKVTGAPGRIFDYSYVQDVICRLKIDGAEINGEEASVVWNSSSIYGNYAVVTLPIALGETERSKVTFDLNGHGGRENKVYYIPGGENDLYHYLSSTDGILPPTDDDYYFCGWYYDPEFTEKAELDNFSSEGDTTLYARWCRFVDEINFTIETPLCGDKVAIDVEEDPNGPDAEYRMPLRRAFDQYISPPGADRVRNTFTNSPKITCDVEGLEVDARWIVSDEGTDTMTPDSLVTLFQGEFRGENDYMFALTGSSGYFSEDPVAFRKNLKIYVNGQEAALNSSLYNFFANQGANGHALRVFAKAGSKAGVISGMKSVYKGSNEFFVVGMITADHVWDEGVITLPAGCETDGTRTYTCRSKDASYDEEIDAYGHKWGEWEVIKPATADEEGIEIRRCANDGEHTQTRAIPKLSPSDPEDNDSRDSSSSGTQNSQPGGNTGNNNSGSQTQNQPTGAGVPIAAAVICVAVVVLILVRKRG